MKNNTIFEELLAVDVNPYLEKKKTGSKELSYLSWPYAWAEIKKRYPDATYKIWQNEQGLPYAFDPKTGYMVFVTLFANGQEFPCFLPVMDEHNLAMKDKQYEGSYYENGSLISATVRPATMFDINKTIMRCLVKACAFAGLGLYVFAGEDINAFSTKVTGKTGEGDNITEKVEAEKNDKDNNDETEEDILDEHRKYTLSKIESVGLKVSQVMKGFNKSKGTNKSFDDLNMDELISVDNMCDNYERDKNKR